MKSISTARRRIHVTMLVSAATLFAAGCSDDTAPEEEPRIVSMRLTVGNQTVNVSDNGTVTGGPLSLAVGANTITAQFLGANGQPEPLVVAGVFELSVEVVGSAPITFTRSSSNPFAGTLTATATATGAQIRFGAFHIEEQHDDFGPWTVTVNVTQ